MAAALTRDDLWTLESYAQQRAQFRAHVLAHKRQRTVQLGDHVTLLFEDVTTVRYQIQEMLRIEKTFEAAGIDQELEAYVPLIPDGSNLKATMMIEYADVQERKLALARLKGVESRVYVQVGAWGRVYAIADEDLERENDEKTSAVHFLRFEFSQPQVSSFKAGERVMLGIDHAHYAAQVQLAPAVCAALAQDFS